jgi:alkylated DNA repair protein alkB family protein 6
MIADKLVADGIFTPDIAPNHALINEYHAGQGIMAHTDGPRYYPQVCVLSLGSPTMFQFWDLVDRIR